MLSPIGHAVTCAVRTLLGGKRCGARQRLMRAEQALILNFGERATFDVARDKMWRGDEVIPSAEVRRSEC